MSGMNGKWKVVSEDNMEEVIKVTGGGEKEVNEYVAAQSEKKDVYETYDIDGDCVKVTHEEGEKTFNFSIQLGQWCDMPSEGEGDSSKILVKEIGKNQYDFSIESSKYKATGTRVITGDDMVMTIAITGAGVTTTRRYKRVK